MLNVYVDDVRQGPNNDFDNESVGWEDWVVVRGVENAKTLLTHNLVNDLSLDHDMGYNSETGKENLSGLNLIKWMIVHNTWPKGNIYIHSSNFIKAQEMKELIDKYQPEY